MNQSVVGAPRRQSNIELLRIVAMAMVMGLHLSVMVVGNPVGEYGSWHGWARILFSSGCVGAVDVFVMISGWFGIRPTLRGGAKLMFQAAWVAVFAIVIVVAGHLGTPTVKAPLQGIGLLGGGWFLMSYVMLFVLAPVLNAFIATAPIRQMVTVLVAFYALQTVLAMTLSTAWLCGGYNPVSFIGLYLLAATLRRWKPNGYRGGIGSTQGVWPSWDASGWRAMPPRRWQCAAWCWAMLTRWSSPVRPGCCLAWPRRRCVTVG